MGERKRSIVDYMFDLPVFIESVGYLGLFGIIFAESGLLVGFFLPGDSLLFTAGFLASRGLLDIVALIIVTFIAAVLGDNVGYAFGGRAGPKVFRRENSFLFHKDHLDRARKFYEEHGGKTIILARFMPVVRTFAPILAGVGRMRYRTFFLYNLAGGALWTAGLSLLGFTLGNMIPNIDRYLIPIILFIIFASLLPNIIHVLKTPAHRARIAAFLHKKFRPRREDF